MCDHNFWVQAPREHLIIEFMLVKLMFEKFSAMRLIFFKGVHTDILKSQVESNMLKKQLWCQNLLYMGVKLLDLKNLH